MSVTESLLRDLNTQVEKYCQSHKKVSREDAAQKFYIRCKQEKDGSVNFYVEKKHFYSPLIHFICRRNKQYDLGEVTEKFVKQVKKEKSDSIDIKQYKLLDLIISYANRKREKKIDSISSKIQESILPEQKTKAVEIKDTQPQENIEPKDLNPQPVTPKITKEIPSLSTDLLNKAKTVFLNQTDTSRVVQLEPTKLEPTKLEPKKVVLKPQKKQSVPLQTVPEEVPQDTSEVEQKTNVSYSMASRPISLSKLNFENIQKVIGETLRPKTPKVIEESKKIEKQEEYQIQKLDNSVFKNRLRKPSKNLPKKENEVVQTPSQEVSSSTSVQQVERIDFSKVGEDGYSDLHRLLKQEELPKDIVQQIETLLSKCPEKERSRYVNLRTAEDGETALMLACRNTSGSIAIMYLLLNNGADLSILNDNCLSVVDYAVDSGNTELVKQVLQACGDVNMQGLLDRLDEEDKTNIAASAKNEEIKKILNEKIKTLKGGETGKTLLMQAAEKGDIDEVGKLIEKGAWICACDDDGWSPLHYAVVSKNQEIVKLLLENCPEHRKHEFVNQKAAIGIGRTPLILAMEDNDQEMIKMLQEAGAEKPPKYAVESLLYLDKLNKVQGYETDSKSLGRALLESLKSRYRENAKSAQECETIYHIIQWVAASEIGEKGCNQNQAHYIKALLLARELITELENKENNPIIQKLQEQKMTKKFFSEAIEKIMKGDKTGFKEIQIALSKLGTALKKNQKADPPLDTHIQECIKSINNLYGSLLSGWKMKDF